jgi:cytoplasmic iron level regulating protein YaaA (DUF328/UPF0246 family)
VALVLILLPPSEGKAVPRRGRQLDLTRLSSPQLNPAREQVVAALVDVCRSDPARAAEVMGLGPTQADDVRRNTELWRAPTARADAVYAGVLYDALDLASLDPAARRRATRWLLITSSLFGVVAPGDRIPSYRLPGATSLPGLGPVAAHWRAVLDPALRAAAGDGLVVDLRSTTYASFWRPAPDISSRVVTVRVLHEAEGRRSVVSHFNKATKGRLVRALLEHGAAPATPAALADTITALGWKAELGDPTRHGHLLDVVVEQV